MLVEQHIEDGLDAQRKGAGRKCIAKCLGNCLGPERIVDLLELLPSGQQCESLVQGKKRLHAARLYTAHHIGDQKTFFVIVILDQAEMIRVDLGAFLFLQAAGKKVVKIASYLLMIAALD